MCCAETKTNVIHSTEIIHNRSKLQPPRPKKTTTKTKTTKLGFDLFRSENTLQT